MMWPCTGSMGGWMLLWWVFGLVLLGALVWVLAGSRGGGLGGRDGTPEQILKQRYAKGEIEREEYQRRLEDLRR